jgi:hypothetical protein
LYLRVSSRVNKVHKVEYSLVIYIDRDEHTLLGKQVSSSQPGVDAYRSLIPMSMRRLCFRENSGGGQDHTSIWCVKKCVHPNCWIVILCILDKDPVSERYNEL